MPVHYCVPLFPVHVVRALEGNLFESQMWLELSRRIEDYVWAGDPVHASALPRAVLHSSYHSFEQNEISSPDQLKL